MGLEPWHSACRVTILPTCTLMSAGAFSRISQEPLERRQEWLER